MWTHLHIHKRIQSVVTKKNGCVSGCILSPQTYSLMHCVLKCTTINFLLVTQKSAHRKQKSDGTNNKNKMDRLGLHWMWNVEAEAISQNIIMYKLMPKQLRFQSNFLVICSMNVLSVPSILLNYNGKNEWWREKEKIHGAGLFYSHLSTCRIERATISLSFSPILRTLKKQWHTDCFKLSKFVTFLSLILPLLLFRQLWLWVFFIILSLFSDSLFPLSVLLKWMNCWFQKYGCCHFAYSLCLSRRQT